MLIIPQSVTNLCHNCFLQFLEQYTASGIMWRMRFVLSLLSFKIANWGENYDFLPLENEEIEAQMCLCPLASAWEKES